MMTKAKAKGKGKSKAAPGRDVRLSIKGAGGRIGAEVRSVRKLKLRL